MHFLSIEHLFHYLLQQADFFFGIFPKVNKTFFFGRLYAKLLDALFCMSVLHYFLAFAGLTESMKVPQNGKSCSSNSTDGDCNKLD